MRPARPRLAFLSAAFITAVAAVLAVVLPVTIASAQTVPAAGNGVGAAHPQMILTVGAPRPVSPGQGRCGLVPQQGIASGACVAAEDSGDLADAATCGGASFTAGTRVLLASGLAVPISQLRVGDKVLATNVRTGKTSAEPVTAVLLHHDTDLYDLTVKTARGTAVIQTTASHLFWDPASRQWVKAAALGHGTRLRTAGGITATVLGGHVPADARGWMWDLSVPGGGDHDFYIDTVNTAVLVHNCPIGPDEGVNPAENPNMGSLNRVSDSQLQEQVGDIHEFKADILGSGAQLSRFNVYVDKSTGYLFLMARGGDPIPTYFNIGGS